MGNLRTRIGNRLKKAGVIYRPTSFTEQQVRQLEAASTAAVTATEQPVIETLAGIQAQLDRLEQAVGSGAFDALEAYAHGAPTPQTALDIFEGEWSSRLPEELGDARAGAIPLFADDRLAWALDVLGGVEGRSVLEIGPLEGGHTYTLDRAGAAGVVSVEANTRAYLKCLVVKELLGIPSAQFLCGDAISYLQQHIARGEPAFDLCVASGVLYHLKNPVEGLHLMTQVSDRLYLWTMYYDDDVIQSRPNLAVRFPSAREAEYQGYKHTLYQQEYQEATDSKSFCGGTAATSAWMTKADILGALDFFGFEVIETAFDRDNGHGPCFAVSARRREG